jgi:hypothetical protein
MKDRARSSARVLLAVMTLEVLAACTDVDATNQPEFGDTGKEPTASLITNDPIEPTTTLPGPGIAVTPGETTEPEPPPTVEVIKTQVQVPGSQDNTFLAVPGGPEGFGGEGDVVEELNNQERQDNLNRQGYAPIVNGGGLLSRTQIQDDSEVCIPNLPDKIYNPDVEPQEDVRIESNSGVVSYGDSETGQIRAKALGAVSTSGIPDEWMCINAVVIDEDNVAGLGALRTLIIDEEGNIKAEAPAAFSGNDSVEVRWENGNPQTYVNGEQVDFEYRDGIELPLSEVIESLNWISGTEYNPGVEREFSLSGDGNTLIETRRDNGKQIRINVAKRNNESSGWEKTSLNEKYEDLLPKDRTYILSDHLVWGLIDVAEGNQAYQSFEIRGVVTGEKKSVNWNDPVSGEEQNIHLFKVALFDKNHQALELNVFLGAEEHNNAKSLRYLETWDDGSVATNLFVGTVEEAAEKMDIGEVFQLTIPFIRPENERPYKAQCYDRSPWFIYCTEPEQTEYHLFQQFELPIIKLQEDLWTGRGVSVNSDELIIPTGHIQVLEQSVAMSDS